MTSEYIDTAIDYASRVVLGDELASRYCIMSCQRFIDDIKRADKGWEWQLEEEFADKPCKFAELMPHVKGRTDLIRLGPWQLFCYVNMFGWVDENGLRRFRTVYIETPKKTGKTTMVAPIALYLLAVEGEEGAEVYSLATTRTQARLVWNVAKMMANRTGEFRERYGVECGSHSIFQQFTGSNFVPLSRESKSLEGINPHGAIVDELHAHKTREVWDIIAESTGARSQPLIVAITNSGVDKASICYEQRVYLIRTLQAAVGDRDETYFGVIHGCDVPEDLAHWDEPRIWHKANPNLGVSVSYSDIEAKAKKARMMPSFRASFMRYQLGVWSEHESPWIRVSEWDACRIEAMPELEGLSAMIAIDLASKIDVAAMVASVALADGTFLIIPRFYVPEERCKEIEEYDGWRREGHVIATPGKTIDYGYIEEDLEEWCALFDVEHVPYDKWQAHQFATNMTAQGLPMIEFVQTVKKFSDPMKEIEAKVLDRTLLHDGNPMMSWMVSNVVVQPDRNENIFPRKESSEEKIDGAVAMIMGMAMWLGEDRPKPSVYTTRGLLLP